MLKNVEINEMKVLAEKIKLFAKNKKKKVKDIYFNKCYDCDKEFLMLNSIQNIKDCYKRVLRNQSYDNVHKYCYTVIDFEFNEINELYNNILRKAELTAEYKVKYNIRNNNFNLTYKHYELTNAINMMLEFLINDKLLLDDVKQSINHEKRNFYDQIVHLKRNIFNKKEYTIDDLENKFQESTKRIDHFKEVRDYILTFFDSKTYFFD